MSKSLLEVLGLVGRCISSEDGVSGRGDGE